MKTSAYQGKTAILPELMTHVNITLTPTTTDDLHSLFQFQLDEQASYLECLTKPFDGVESDECAGEFGKGEVDVFPSFVSHTQAAEAVEPGEGAFHDPAVPS